MSSDATTANMAPPKIATGLLYWARKNLFSSPLNIVLTLLSVWLLLLFIPPFIEWALIDAVWQADSGQACRAAGKGACWAFIAEKYRLMLFGVYPYDEQWRPLLASVVFIAVIVASCMRRFWNSSLFFIWVIGLGVAAWLMWGGLLGLRHVENDRWGGLPVTLMLSVFGMVFAFPLGILLALGRRSHMPAIKTLCVTYIELIRGVPLISLLFMASVMLPLFLPPGVNFDKLLRAQVAIIMFAAAYLAEVIRGGLQALPKGQYEAADALGLSYWQKMRLIILPQALKLVIPPLVNSFIAVFKDTSLVVIIGLFDLLSATNVALTDQKWQGFAPEAYLPLALLYFCFCYSMSKYSQHLEVQLSAGQRRN